jgi:hypothetical protein
VLLACEKLRDALRPVADDKGGDLSWKELVAAAQGDANGFGPSKARRGSTHKLTKRVTVRVRSGSGVRM